MKINNEQSIVEYLNHVEKEKQTALHRQKK